MPTVVETPLTYFRKFVSSSMMPSVVEQTNLHSTQEIGNSIHVTEREIEKCFGKYLMMRLVQMPSVRCYWENGTMFPVVADIMPRNRFEKPMRLLHFEENSIVSETQSKTRPGKYESG